MVITSSDKNRKYINKAKKGISPVVATVILVAVAVVIAAALAGFSGSLFSTYSSTGSVSVRSLSLTIAGTPPCCLNGNAIIVNKGGVADLVLDIIIPPSVTTTGAGSTPTPTLSQGALSATGTATATGGIWLAQGTPPTCGTAPYTLDTTHAPSVPANSETLICFLSDQPIPALTVGQQLTLKIKMKSGVELTQSTTIAP